MKYQRIKEDLIPFCKFCLFSREKSNGGYYCIKHGKEYPQEYSVVPTGTCEEFEYKDQKLIIVNRFIKSHKREKHYAKKVTIRQNIYINTRSLL